MEIAGLSYRIENECWICDDERVYSVTHGGYTEWRITLLPTERILYGWHHHVSIVRYVYVALYGRTENKIRHSCNEMQCINPEHLYNSAHATRISGYGNTVCLNCFSLHYVKGTGGKMVQCIEEVYKGGKEFPTEDAFKHSGCIRPNCPYYETEEEQHWSIEKYRQMKRNLLQPTLC